MLFILQQSQAKHKKIHTHAQFIVKYTIAHTHTHSLTLTQSHTDTRTHFHTYSYRVTYRIWLTDASYWYACEYVRIHMCVFVRVFTHTHTHTCTFACLPICWGNKCKCLSVNQTGHYWLLVRAKHYRRALRMRVCTHTDTLTHANTNIHTMHIHTCLFLHCNLKWSTVWRWPICRLAPFGSAARE